MAEIRLKEAPKRDTRNCPIHEGFVVELAWLPPKRERQMRSESYFSKRGQYRPREGGDEFTRRYCQTVIKGWHGLTLEMLEQYFLCEPVDDDLALCEEMMRAHGELPFSQTLARHLYENAPFTKFAQKIDEFIEDWSTEEAATEDARLGKSDASLSSAQPANVAPLPRTARTASD